MHPCEQRCCVLEIVESSDGTVLHQVLEEVLSGGVGSDPCVDNDTHSSSRPGQRAVQLGEHRVDVDVTTSGEWVTPTKAQELTLALCLSLGFLDLGVERLALRILFQSLDEPLTCSRVRGLCDLCVPLGEDLLFLEFDPLPRRVSDHAVEPSGPS